MWRPHQYQAFLMQRSSDLMKPLKVLNIATSPHISSGAAVDAIMRQVIYALLPIVMFAVYLFGWSALLVITTAVLSCLLSEFVLCRALQQESTLSDGATLITGLLYGLTLPPSLPLWMVSVGAVVAVALGKFIFGGLGCNVFNPALVGRAFLQVAFPNSMTHWLEPQQADRFSSLAGSTLTTPFMSPHYDVVSGATPLALMKYSQDATENNALLFGLTSGSCGETSALLILICGTYLILRKVADWRIPVGIFGAIIVFSGFLNWLNPAHFAGPLFMLGSGGLMLGALFMATDPVASPVSSRGAFVYGVLMGILIVIIRYWSGLPEGVMYAILLGNSFSPHIDHWLQPKVFGKTQLKQDHNR